MGLNCYTWDKRPYVPTKDENIGPANSNIGYRRRRADMLQIYRIIKGIDQVKQEEHFILAGRTSTRGHSYKILKVRSNTTLKQHLLGVRAINDWNAITKKLYSLITSTYSRIT